MQKGYMPPKSMCRSFVKWAKEQFQDPEFRAEFEAWQEARKLESEKMKGGE